MYIAAGKVILDFWGNESLKEKRNQLAMLLDDVQRKHNVSALEVSDFDDLEKCVIGFALCAGTKIGAENALKKILEFIDTTSFARVMIEDSEVIAYD